MCSLWRRLLCLIFILPALVWAGSIPAPVAVDAELGQINLSGQLLLLRDPQGQFSFSEIQNRSADMFEPATGENLVTGFNAGIFWLRVALHNPSSQQLERWLAVGTAKTQRVSFYLGQGGNWQVLNSGRRVAVLARPLASTAPVFPVTIPAGQSVDLLLRVDSQGTTDMSTTLWQPASYLQAVVAHQFYFALLLGGFLLAASLAFLAYIRLREDQYFWLGCLLIGTMGLEASRENLLSTYFWPPHIALPPQSLAFFALLALFSTGRVAAHAFELKQRWPKADRLLQGLRWGAVVATVLTAVSYGHGVRVLSMIAVAMHCSILFFGVMAWRSGRQNGRLFLVAFSLALMTETARQLANLGVLPWLEAMNFSMVFYLLATPLILLGLIDQTRRLRERLQYSETIQQAKASFLSQISHELRSPLNTILGYSRMLQRGSGSLPLAEGTVGIEKSTLRLLRLIDELLDESRAAAGKLTISPAPFALQPWLQEIGAAAPLVIETQGNQFHLELKGELPVAVLADATRLRQVLDNLLSNANRHTKHGCIRLRVESTLSALDARLVFSVIDEGEGIPADAIAMLFEPFMRLGTATAGHGLGLPICRDLVRQMGGDIIVKSQPGSGSEFTFALNFPLATALPLSSPSELQQIESNCPKVLLVDDDPAHLGMRVQQLERAGLALASANGGHEALALLPTTTWDLVITDQNMPDTDGWALLNQIRKYRLELPVILISAATPCRPAGLPEGIAFDGMLDKSVTENEFIAAAWCHVLNLDPSIPKPDWSALGILAKDGEVSGIAEWIDSYRAKSKDGTKRLKWIERYLHQLSFELIEDVARKMQS